MTIESQGLWGPIYDSSAHYFRSLVNQLPEAVAVHELVFSERGNPVNYRIIDVNSQYENFTGIPRQTAIGKLATELYRLEEPPYFEEFRTVAQTLVPRQLETDGAPNKQRFQILVLPLGKNAFATVFTPIAEQRRNGKALSQGGLADAHHAAEELSSYFALSNDIVCVANSAGVIVEFNPAWQRILGYEPAELLHKQFIDFVHPDDVTSTIVATNALREGKPFKSFENRYRHKDGSYRWLEWRPLGSPIGKTELNCALATDVTERHLADAAITRSREQLIRVSELAQIGHFSASIKTRKTEWTTELFRIYGRNPDEFSPTFDDMRAPIQREDRFRADKAMVVAAKRHTSKRVEFRIRRPNGEVRHCLAIVEGHTPNDGNAYNLYGLVQDLTDLKRTEEDRRKLEQQVMQAQKLESLGVLAGGIAHDFNNLLTSILGNTDLALSDLPSDNPVNAYLKDIEIVSRRAADLCRQMLAYSGRGRFVVQPVAINALMEEMAHLLNASTGKKVVLHYNLQNDLPAVMADASQIRQVIVSLVTNASEAIGEHNGRITLTTGTMACNEAYLRTVVRDGVHHSPGQYVYLEVSDTGSGMTQATLERIFEPFFTTKFTGRGLGLAAVMGIVRGHKGALKVHSETGKGTVLRVLFPAYLQKTEVPITPPLSPRQWKGHGFVLLVDDEEAILNSSRQLLSRAGFEVLTAADGRNAVELYALHKDEVRLVILDLTMPHLDGESCFHELRRLDPKVKVIMTSGYDAQDVISRFEGQGIAGFLQKPYQAVELLPLIRSTLGE